MHQAAVCLWPAPDKPTSAAGHTGKNGASGAIMSSMKALLLNGSPQKEESTFTALEQVARGLEANGVAAEIVWLGDHPIKPCVACGACNTAQRCAFGNDDGVNTLIEALQAADALVVGSPVFYSGMNGSLKAALDRIFFAAGSTYALKPAGAVVCARRAGTTATLDQILKYFLISEMPVVSSFYWTMMHGQNAEQVMQDEEGVQSAYQLGANMAWLLQSIAAGREAGITPARTEDRAWTNFIR
jgi:multimeric flavodoxin WrbA